MAKKNEGRIFEDSFEASCKKLKIFFSRNRDVMIPPDLRARVRVPKNPYDYFMFSSKYLFPLELKSTKSKSLSFSESIVKQHQIDSLLAASKYEDVFSGFLINFRGETNRTFFVNIVDFVYYQQVANGEIIHTYENKINKSSIPISIVDEIGIEIKSSLKKVNYHYHVDEFVDEAIKRYK